MLLLEMINQIPEPRMKGKVQHSLSAIIFTALCGVLSGCESWSDIYDYCTIKRDWLSKFVSFKNGIPSSDTFRRIFTMLDPSLKSRLYYAGTPAL